MELPDVVRFARYLDATALHREVASVEVRDARVLAGTSGGELRDALVGRAFGATRHHGKVLFVTLEGEGPALMLHFGMTGTVRCVQRADHEPEHVRLAIHFEDGGRMLVTSQRLFGEVRLCPDPEAFLAEEGLGPDALDELPDEAALRAAIGDHRGMVKTALTDQHTLAGIGNVFADEILFQARIHPRKQVAELTDGEWARLDEHVRSVLTTASSLTPTEPVYPSDWLLQRREPGADCPRCRGTVERIDLAGRPAYLCPECQPCSGDGTDP